MSTAIQSEMNGNSYKRGDGIGTFGAMVAGTVKNNDMVDVGKSALLTLSLLACPPALTQTKYVLP